MKKNRIPIKWEFTIRDVTKAWGVNFYVECRRFMRRLKILFLEQKAAFDSFDSRARYSLLLRYSLYSSSSSLCQAVAESPSSRVLSQGPSLLLERTSRVPGWRQRLQGFPEPRRRFSTVSPSRSASLPSTRNAWEILPLTSSAAQWAPESLSLQARDPTVATTCLANQSYSLEEVRERGERKKTTSKWNACQRCFSSIFFSLFKKLQEFTYMDTLAGRCRSRRSSHLREASSSPVCSPSARSWGSWCTSWHPWCNRFQGSRPRWGKQPGTYRTSRSRTPS